MSYLVKIDQNLVLYKAAYLDLGHCRKWQRFTGLSSPCEIHYLVCYILHYINNVNYKHVMFAWSKLKATLEFFESLISRKF